MTNRDNGDDSSDRDSQEHHWARSHTVRLQRDYAATKAAVESIRLNQGRQPRDRLTGTLPSQPPALSGRPASPALRLISLVSNATPRDVTAEPTPGTATERRCHLYHELVSLILRVWRSPAI